MAIEGKERRPIRRTVLLACLVLLMLVYAYRLLDEQGILGLLMDSERLKDWIDHFGHKGPAVMMALMAIAIIINPVPSAPIALAAGAAFGHVWGTVYVVAGATIGALGAFWIARLLGHRLLVQWFGDRIQTGWVGSQNTLTGLVFVSRLIPFISFDLVSYGAGLTPLKTWRFTAATLIGLVPVSFLLTHFGGELAAAGLDRLLIIVLLLGFATLLPLLVHRRRKRRHARQRERARGHPD